MIGAKVDWQENDSRSLQPPGPKNWYYGTLQHSYMLTLLKGHHRTGVDVEQNVHRQNHLVNDLRHLLTKNSQCGHAAFHFPNSLYGISDLIGFVAGNRQAIL
jgi:hypothetical protein